MGYDALVDGSCYSSEVGAMKPDRAFFERVLADLDIDLDDPGEVARVGFVDDLEANVEAAARLSIRAVRHVPSSGAPGLRRVLTPLVPSLTGRGPAREVLPRPQTPS